MPRTRSAKEMEDLLIAGMEEALAITRGEIKPARVRTRTFTARDAQVAPPSEFDAQRVVAVRKALEVSQPVFAQVLNVSPKLVQAWERGVRTPKGASQRLLEVAERKGEYLTKTIAKLSRPSDPGSRGRGRDPSPPGARVRQGQPATQHRSGTSQLQGPTRRGSKTSAGGSHVKRGRVAAKKVR